jgi:hypothetical protein
MFPQCAPMTFYPTESAFIPWKQKIHSPPTKRLTFTLGDARIELMQYVLCMHKGLEVIIGNLYTDRSLSNENHSWVYTLKGTYSTWDDFFRHAYKLAVKHEIINEEHLMNITHDNATEAYFQAHPHHVQLLKDMEQTEKETKEIVRKIVEEIKAIKAEIKEKAKSTQTPFPIIPTFADKKSLHQVASKETFANWNIRVYATEKTHTLHTNYYVLIKNITAKHKNWITKKDGGFPSYEEAYYAAILWITHMQGYETIAINDMKIQSAYPSKTS